MLDEHIYKSHNKTLVNICEGISERYEIVFIEIGYESNHVHFLVKSVPNVLVSQMVLAIKNLTAREMFRLHPEIKSLLWGGGFWRSGFYANTVGLYAS